jgi:REP-associated tyrosine transposase
MKAARKFSMNGGKPLESRRSVRLMGFDYAEPGAYFVTIVTQERSCLFGEIIEGQMQVNRAGEAITRWWLELTRKFTTVETDEFIVMPNHCHGIIVIVDPTVGADLRVGPPNDRTGAHAGAPLPTIVQWFKTMTTNEYIRGVKTLGWPSFRGQLWQRSYYEHVIRNADSLNRIRQYIIDNPVRWEFDRENPAATAVEPDIAC